MNHRINGSPVRALSLFAAAILAGCGGGGGSSASSATNAVTGGSSSTTTPTTTPTALSISKLELAQTHVLPEAGRRWQLTDGSGKATADESLHLTGGRDALALVALSVSDAASPQIEGWMSGKKLGAVALKPPAQLPATEDQGEAYASDRYSAVLPGAWMQPGVQLRATAGNHTPSEFHAPVVGGDFPITLRVLPFYVFGADESNTQTLSVTGAPDAATQQEIFDKWPVAALQAANHPAAKAVWPTLVIAPRGDSAGTAQPAYVASKASDYKDGFAGMSAVINVVKGLLVANGEAPQPVQYYAPLLALDSSGKFLSSGGGLGGGSVGVGDTSYRGIFIHEQGHAFGLPHAGEAFDQFKYPYEWGSLNGSSWGYDAHFQEFLAPFVPSSAPTFKTCTSDTFAGHARAFDSQNRCVKQDPMQSGSGDQSQHYRFATFADYSTAVMQRYFEGRTTVANDGSHSYSGGKVVRDSSFPGGYRRWDTVDRQWVNFTPTTTQGGIFGLDQGLPLTYDTPVYAIALTLSNAGTSGATQIYPPIRFTGNLMRTFDPTSASDRAAFTPDTSPTYFWYCRNGGCDYTLRVTYANGSQRNVLLQGGFRPFNQPSGTPASTTTDPTNDNSFRVFVVNVPDNGNLLKVELLSTPMAWQGMPVTPAVLASR